MGKLWHSAIFRIVRSDEQGRTNICGLGTFRDSIPADAWCLRKKCADSTLHLAARCDGRSNSSFCAHSCRDDGHSRCLSDCAHVSILRTSSRSTRHCCVGWWIDRAACCHNRHGAVRHQTSLRIFHNFTTGLYVPWTWSRNNIWRVLSHLDSRLLQGSFVPHRWRNHAWICRST